MRVNFAVWGLTKAIQHMVENDAFRKWRFTLLWQDIVMGSIWFISTSPPGVAATINGNGISPTQNHTETLLSAGGHSEAGSTSLGSSVSYSAGFVGRSIAFRDAMMAIVGGLTITATNDEDQLVDSRSFVGFYRPLESKFILIMPTSAGCLITRLRLGLLLLCCMRRQCSICYVKRAESWKSLVEKDQPSLQRER